MQAGLPSGNAGAPEQRLGCQSFHYPPELFNLMVDVVPLLTGYPHLVLLRHRVGYVQGTASTELVAAPSPLAFSGTAFPEMEVDCRRFITR
jgi:hypothetical protein